MLIPKSNFLRLLRNLNNLKIVLEYVLKIFPERSLFAGIPFTKLDERPRIDQDYPESE